MDREPAGEKHHQIDLELRRIAKQRAGLDGLEARWLREAERYRIWRALGFSTALEYLEDVFGYAPRTAMERLRVAKDLGELPQLEAELATGALPYSAAKELSRVMTAETQAEWLARARGKNLRDIEEMVSGRKKGDSPDAPADPELIVHEVRLTLTARTKALWDQMRAVLEVECDSHLDDDQLAEVVTRRVLDGDGSPSDKPLRPPHRIVLHKCEDCSRAWQETRGRWIELTPADLALAECDAMIARDNASAVTEAEAMRVRENAPPVAESDAMVVDEGQSSIAECDAVILHHAKVDSLAEHKTTTLSGNEHSAASAKAKASAKQKQTVARTGHLAERVQSKSVRAISDIPEKTRKRVWARDRGRCCVPGCRATRHIDLHHVIPRALGGTHEESNLVLACSGHHKLLHDGILSITGRAPDGLVFKRDGKRLVEPRGAGVTPPAAPRSSTTPPIARNRFADVAKLEHAKQALRQLGLSARTARAALEEASAHVDANADVAQLVQVAFERSRQQVTESVTREAVGDEAMKLATQALVQLGYPSAVATSAVNAARAHVGTADLATLIKDALQRTSS